MYSSLPYFISNNKQDIVFFILGKDFQWDTHKPAKMWTYSDQDSLPSGPGKIR